MKKLEKGFTLIELMIVVAIIGILAAIGAPKFGGQIKRAKDGKALATIQTWRGAANLYYADELIEATKTGDLLEYVDEKTQNATYEDATNTISSADNEVYVEAGTGESGTVGTKSVQIVKFETTGGAISIKTSGTNTAGTTWSSL